jgi:hypothetical protein
VSCDWRMPKIRKQQASVRVLASAVGRLPSLRSGVNAQAGRLASSVAVQGS